MEYKFKPTPMPRRSLSTKKIMLRLLIGLLAVYAFGLYNSFRIGGTDYLVNAILLMVVAIACSFAAEIVYALMIKKPIKEIISTSFPLITPVILVLTVTPNTSLYAIAIATLVAVVFGKLVFGGFGQNIFNPAAVGRAVIIQSFAGVVALDAVSGATITSQFAKLNWICDPNSFLAFVESCGGLSNIVLGLYEGAIGETSTLLILAVAIFYAIYDVIDWRIPATYLGIMFGAATIAGLVNGLGIDYALVFVSTGGAAFAGVFMLTDPVTNPQTRPGKIVFAALAALFTVAIRLLANLPEGVVFSILLVNILSPAIDKLFSTKQIESIKRNIAITFGTIAIALVCGILIIANVTPGKYQDSQAGASTSEEAGASTSEEAGASTSEEAGASTSEVAGASESAAIAGVLADADYTTYEAVVTSDGNNYHVSVHGFHALENGPDNEFDIEIENDAIKSIKCIVFSDTEGVGSPAVEEGALAKYVGTTLNDEVDVMAGCSYTSNSINAAIQAALKEASK